MTRQLELSLIVTGESQTRQRSEEAAPATAGTEGSGASGLMAQTLSRPNLLAALKRVRNNENRAWHEAWACHVGIGLPFTSKRHQGRSIVSKELLPCLEHCYPVCGVSTAEVWMSSSPWCGPPWRVVPVSSADLVNARESAALGANLLPELNQSRLECGLELVSVAAPFTLDADPGRLVWRADA